MGIWSDIFEAVLPWSEAQAEAPAKEEEEEKDSGDDKPEEEGQGGEEKEEEKEEEPEEEEEEEEEIVDPKETIEEECKESKQCSPAKHHFDECVERVHGAAEGKHDKAHPGEDCVEEFFHLAHCATNCAAPKLWAALK